MTLEQQAANQYAAKLGIHIKFKPNGLIVALSAKTHRQLAVGVDVKAVLEKALQQMSLCR